MKKLNKFKLSQNAELLAEDEMKMIVGGYGSGTTCSVSQQCAGTTLSCSNDKGNCGTLWGTINGQDMIVGVWCGTDQDGDYKELKCRG